MADSTSIFESDPTSITPSQRLAQAHAALNDEQPLLESNDVSEDDAPAAPTTKDSRLVSPANQSSLRDVNFSDESAFPSLGGSSSSTKSKSLWGNARTTTSVPPVASQVITANDLKTETLKLEASQQQPRSLGKNNAGDVVKAVQKSTNTTIQMSTAQKTGTIVFLIKGKPEAVASARRTLLKELSKKVSDTIQSSTSTHEC